MVATQRIQVGLIHARKIVSVTAADDHFRLVIDVHFQPQQRGALPLARFQVAPQLATPPRP